MISGKIFVVFACLLHVQSAVALWQCTLDSDCASLAGSVCVQGGCSCPPGQQSVLGGTVCLDVAPYHTSQCVEDFQCSRLFTSFQCRRDTPNSEAGQCFCNPGFHYFLGRCWPILDMGDTCSRSEECLGVLRDPFSMSCQGSCECAEGYYLRQRGECRRIGTAVGSGCVLDEDCRFEGGACDGVSFLCYNRNTTRGSQMQGQLPVTSNTAKAETTNSVTTNSVTTRVYGAECSVTQPCPDHLECSSFGVCLCPLGYYSNTDGSICLAELGSPVTNTNQCEGFFTEVRDGVCTCQANFFFNEDMRTCTKVVRSIADACIVDANCHTFGALSRCGSPQQWGIRYCECTPDVSVWDANRNLCRLFAGIGETCDVDSDCLAGDLEIQCVADAAGQGRCACPDGYVAVDGLCLTLGLELGDTCQVSLECTGTPNTVCSDGVCACDAGYQTVGDQCAPALGGNCQIDDDCVISNSGCDVTTSTCLCREGFEEYEDVCWEAVAGFGAPCNVTQQCAASMGSAGECVDNTCACSAGYHYRDGNCWIMTGLFESCSRSSQCFLADRTEIVECRNSLCQCIFDYPFSEELGTCRSSAASIVGNSFIIVTTLFYLFSR